MNAEILAVGTELLMGQIANTNAQYISNRLPDAGVNVFFHSVVGDNPERLKQSLKLALGRSDAVIMTGGLGPTQDDLTKETVCELMGRKLVLHEESLNEIKEHFRKVNRPMVDSNIKQAYLPEGCKVVENKRGTAPGCIVESGGKIVVMLPGPPSEMQPMFEDTVLPYFKEKSDYRIVSQYVKIFGVGESSLEQQIIDLINNQTNPTIATYVKESEVTLRITAKVGTGEDASRLINPVVDEIRKRFGNAVYSAEDIGIEKVAAKLLLDTHTTISLAESCTAGLVASKLAEIPGISAVLDRAAVTYSNKSKTEELGVKPETLDKFGAVSKETAVEMASGMRTKAGTDIAVSVTGIAGPEGGTPEKPVGLVYIALADSSSTRYRELRLRGDRNRIRNVTALHVFDMIRSYIEQKKQ